MAGVRRPVDGHHGCGALPRAPTLASWDAILESMDHYRQSVLACGAATELTEDGAGCYAYDGCDGATLCEYVGVGQGASSEDVPGPCSIPPSPGRSSGAP